MSDQSQTDRLTCLIAEILRIPTGEIVDTLDMEETGTWDSLSHMQLIAAIENDFRVELSMDDIVAMRSVAAIKSVLRSRNVGV